MFNTITGESHNIFLSNAIWSTIIMHAPILSSKLTGNSRVETANLSTTSTSNGSTSMIQSHKFLVQSQQVITVMLKQHVFSHLIDHSLIGPDSRAAADRLTDHTTSVLSLVFLGAFTVASPASRHVGTCPPPAFERFFSLGYTLKQVVRFRLVLCQTLTQHYLFSRICF